MMVFMPKLVISKEMSQMLVNDDIVDIHCRIDSNVDRKYQTHDLPKLTAVFQKQCEAIW